MRNCRNIKPKQSNQTGMYSTNGPESTSSLNEPQDIVCSTVCEGVKCLSDSILQPFGCFGF